MVLVTIRPDADASNTGWSDQAGGTTNLYQTIDETTASDTDYIRSSENPTADIVRFRIGDPGSALAEPFTITYRYGTTGTGTCTITARLKQGSTVIKAWAHTDATTTLQTVTQTLTTGEFSSITDFNDLFVEFEAGPAGSGFTPTSTESSNFLTRATGITSDTDKTRYDALITGLVTDGLFSKLDALYIFAAPTQAEAVRNLVSSSYTATEHGTPAAWAAGVGYTGDGSSFSLDTGFIPFSATTPKYVQDSASVGIYILNNVVSDAKFGFGTSNNTDTRLTTFGGSWYWDINNNSSSQNVSFGGVTTGQWIMTRTAGSGANSSGIYKNGSTSFFTSASTASNAVPRNSIYFFSADAGGNPSTFKMSSAFFGSGLSNTENAALAARINTFMTAYGINVY